MSELKQRVPTAIALPWDEIQAFCQRWPIAELALFGSILRDDFRPDSDIDFLVTFQPDVRISWSQWMEMERELAAIVQRKVDFVSKRGLKRSQNYIRRDLILNTAQPIYATQ